MKLITYEQRIRGYKEQKYKLLIAKQDVQSTFPVDEQLLAMIDETIELVNGAINTTLRIIENLRSLESEIKGYQIIESRLEQLMFDYNLVEASTQLNTNKLNRVGEHLQHLEQLIKYKQ